MEWVETTGRSVQEAKDAALDELGVDEADAEFEVVAEAQTGLFGRLRSEARVRARVRPTAPRAKEDRRNRDRRRRSGGQGREGGGDGNGRSSDGGRSSEPAPDRADQAEPSEAPAASAARTATASAGAAGGGAAAGTVRTQPDDDTSVVTGADTGSEAGPSDGPADRPGADEAGDGAGGAARPRRRNRRRGGNRPGAAPSEQERASAEEPDFDDDGPAKGSEVDVDLDRQAEVAADFLSKLTAEFGLEAKVGVARPDEDTVELQLTGSDLGILIGPKGSTLLAIQNLTRTVVFNETGGNNGHINVDVGGYRQKRTEALVRFSRQVAEQVKTSGNRTALEPMSAVDRKVVHDTISSIEGVSTISEGEEPRRRVVVLPG